MGTREPVAVSHFLVAVFCATSAGEMISLCLFMVILLPHYLSGEESCGHKPVKPFRYSAFIVGGEQSPEGAWPWQVSVQFRKEDAGKFEHVCGGVLIKKRWVLTVAHCVDAPTNNHDPRREEPQNYQLVFGAHNISSTTEDTQQIRIDLIIKHKDFNPSFELGVPNDIALMRLVSDVDTSPPGVGTACLPLPDMDFTGNPDSWITGWGKTAYQNPHISDVLIQAKTNVIANDYCEELTIGTIISTHVCAGEGMPNACSGDSGGPLSSKAADGRWYVAGLGSWTIATCNYVPVVFTRMSSYHQWVIHNINASLSSKMADDHTETSAAMMDNKSIEN